MRVTVQIVRTAKSLAVLWEQGGGFSNTGRATLVAGPNGEKLRPLYVRRKGHLACEDHALFRIWPGCLVAKAGHSRRNGEEVVVWRIEEIRGEEAELVRLFTRKDGVWDREPPPGIRAFAEEAARKAHCYHCRHPHWASLEGDRGA